MENVNVCTTNHVMVCYGDCSSIIWQVAVILKNVFYLQEVKINKWDATAVKHALDDAVKNALFSTRPQLKEQFGLINTRLVFCTLAVGVAVLAHCWDFTHPFPESKPVLMLCVIAYFALMAILNLHTTFREKGTFAVAIEKTSNGSQRTWEASSDMQKYDDKYTLVLSVKDSKALREATSVKSCALFIDTNGFVVDKQVANEVNRLFNSLSVEKKEKQLVTNPVENFVVLKDDNEEEDLMLGTTTTMQILNV